MDQSSWDYERLQLRRQWESQSLGAGSQVTLEGREAWGMPSFLWRIRNRHKLSGLKQVLLIISVLWNRNSDWLSLIICSRSLRAVIKVCLGCVLVSRDLTGEEWFWVHTDGWQNSSLCGCKTEVSGFLLTIDWRPSWIIEAALRSPPCGALCGQLDSMAVCFLKASRRIPHVPGCLHRVSYNTV